MESNNQRVVFMAKFQSVLLTNIQINRLLIGPACLLAYTANLVHRLSTTKNGATYPPKRHWAEVFLPAWTNPSPPSCFLLQVVHKRQFLLCGQIVKLKPISSLVTWMSMVLLNLVSEYSLVSYFYSLTVSVTSKKLPNVYISCPKIISLEK